MDEIDDIDGISNGNTLLLAGGNGNGYKVDIETQKLLATLKGHSDYFTCNSCCSDNGCSCNRVTRRYDKAMG